MKKLLITTTLAAGFFLGGCASTGTVGPTVDQIIEDVRALTRTTCSFLPLATTVAEILATGNPVLVTATAVANAICGAVTAPAATRGEHIPTVSGVPVRGQFVR